VDRDLLSRSRIYINKKTVPVHFLSLRLNHNYLVPVELCEKQKSLGLSFMHHERFAGCLLRSF